MLPVGNMNAENRRQHLRPRFLKHVKIIFNGQKCVYDAHLKNVSAYGAQLESRLSEFMPGEFNVHFVEDDFTVPCRVKWRRKDILGVEFCHGSH